MTSTPPIIDSSPKSSETATSTTPPPSPPRTLRRVSATLNVASVASLFVRMRRQESSSAKAKSNDDRPAIPRQTSVRKAHHIDSNSGPDGLTHPSLQAKGVTVGRRNRIEHVDLYRTADAVDTPKLLRVTRMKLLEKAQALGLGFNVLVDEKWACTICGPKHRSDGSFKVTVRYAAYATQSDLPDSGQPVALDQAKGVPGLMTILERRS